MILRVGLTGGIASGKSTVAKMLAELGCVVIDADRVVQDLYRPGQRGHRAIVEEYGENVLTAEGDIDRAKLSSVALATPESAARLNALIHPMVIEETERRIKAIEDSGEDAIVVVEATLMIESGSARNYDRLIVVFSNRTLQMERGVKRGMEPAEVERRISRQMPTEERLRHADYAIRNDGSLDDLRGEVKKVFAALNTEFRSQNSE